MTLSRLSATFYLTVLILGSIWGIKDAFDTKNYYGMSPILVYILIIIMQTYGFLMMGHAMIKYSQALSRPAQKPLIDVKVNVGDDKVNEYYDEEYDSEEDTANAKKKVRVSVE